MLHFLQKKDLFLTFVPTNLSNPRGNTGSRRRSKNNLRGITMGERAFMGDSLSYLHTLLKHSENHKVVKRSERFFVTKST